MNHINYLKKTGTSFLYCIGVIIVSTLFITLLHYFNIIGFKTLNFFKLFIPIVSLFVGGNIMGRKSKKNGWKEGLLFGVLFLVFLLIFNYLAFNHFKITDFIYYLILATSSTFGGMVGINHKKTSN